MRNPAVDQQNLDLAGKWSEAGWFFYGIHLMSLAEISRHGLAWQEMLIFSLPFVLFAYGSEFVALRRGLLLRDYRYLMTYGTVISLWQLGIAMGVCVVVGLISSVPLGTSTIRDPNKAFIVLAAFCGIGGIGGWCQYMRATRFAAHEADTTQVMFDAISKAPLMHDPTPIFCSEENPCETIEVRAEGQAFLTTLQPPTPETFFVSYHPDFIVAAPDDVQEPFVDLGHAVADQEAIHDTEDRLGVPFPPEVVALYLRQNGGQVGDIVVQGDGEWHLVNLAISSLDDIETLTAEAEAFRGPTWPNPEKTIVLDNPSAHLLTIDTLDGRVVLSKIDPRNGDVVQVIWENWSAFMMAQRRVLDVVSADN